MEKGHITELLDKIKPALHAEKETTQDRNSTNETFVHHITELNVANTMQNIYKRSSILHTMIEQNEVAMVGAVYDVHRGKVQYKNYEHELNQLDGKKNEALIARLKTLLVEAKVT